MKNLRFILFILVLLSTPVFAANNIDLSEHGKELIRASFPIRYAFSRKYHKDWTKSSYNEREEFLTEWHLKQAQASKESLEQAKQEVREAKAKAKEKKAKQRAEQQRLKAKAQKEKAEDKANKARKKNFDKTIKNSQRALNQLRK